MGLAALLLVGAAISFVSIVPARKEPEAKRAIVAFEAAQVTAAKASAARELADEFQVIEGKKLRASAPAQEPAGDVREAQSRQLVLTQNAPAETAPAPDTLASAPARATPRRAAAKRSMAPAAVAAPGAAVVAAAPGQDVAAAALDQKTPASPAARLVGLDFEQEINDSGVGRARHVRADPTGGQSERRIATEYGKPRHAESSSQRTSCGSEFGGASQDAAQLANARMAANDRADLGRRLPPLAIKAKSPQLVDNPFMRVEQGLARKPGAQCRYRQLFDRPELAQPEHTAFQGRGAHRGDGELLLVSRRHSGGRRK